MDGDQISGVEFGEDFGSVSDLVFDLGEDFGSVSDLGSDCGEHLGFDLGTDPGTDLGFSLGPISWLGMLILVSILVQSLGTNLLLREFGTTTTPMMTSLLLNTLATVLFQDTVLMVSNSKKKKGSLTVFMMDIMISFQAASSFCFGFGIVLTSPYG